MPLLKLKVINAGNSGDIDNGGDIEKHLENFTAYALHQSQPVESFIQTNWSNSCEKRLKLLEHCATWKLECLDFEDDDNDPDQEETTVMGEAMEGMGRVSCSRNNCRVEDFCKDAETWECCRPEEGLGDYN